MEFHVLKTPRPDTCDADTEFHAIDGLPMGDALRCLRPLRRQVTWRPDREKSRDREASGGVFIEGERPPQD